MIFKIDDVADITKLIGALKLMVKGEFVVSKELLDQVINKLRQFAREKGVTIKVISPSGERILIVTSIGAVLGSLVGLYFGGAPGAFLGAVVGGGVGFSLTHITLVMSTLDCGDVHLRTA